MGGLACAVQAGPRERARGEVSESERGEVSERGVTSYGGGMVYVRGEGAARNSGPGRGGFSASAVRERVRAHACVCMRMGRACARRRERGVETEEGDKIKNTDQY